MPVEARPARPAGIVVLATLVVAATKILADHLPPLAPLAEFLGDSGARVEPLLVIR